MAGNDPPKGKGPDPVVAPPLRVSFDVGVFDSFRTALTGVTVTVSGKGIATQTKTTDPTGFVTFGPVDPRILLDITVSKAGFQPSTIGGDHVRRHAPISSPRIILFQLTQSVALLSIRVVQKGVGNLAGALVGVDGVTAALVPTRNDGLAGPFTVPAGTLMRFHAQKDGFSPDPPTQANFNQAVVGNQTLLDGQIFEAQLILVHAAATVTIRVDQKGVGPLKDALVQVDGVTGQIKTLADGTVPPISLEPGKEFRIQARKEGFSPDPPTKDNFNKEVDTKRTFAQNETVTVVLTLAENPFVTPKIDPAGPFIVVVKKSYTKPKRRELTLSIDVDFDGKGTLTVNRTGGGDVKAFDKQIDDASAVEIPIGGAGKDFTGPELKTGVKVFIEAAATSSKVDDVELVLTLSGGTKNKRDPAKVKFTAAELTLDICKSRTTSDVKVDPDPLPEADKTGAANPKSRSVHRQINNKHGRAILIVRKPKPDGLAATLTLSQLPLPSGGGTVSLFDAEVPAAGQAAKALPFEFAPPAADTKFFAEGTTESAAAADTGFQLGLKGIEDQADLARMTVVEFTNYKITVPVTPPNKTRATPSNAVTPPSQEFKAPGTNNLDFEEDFTLADVLVMMENSTSLLDPIELEVTVTPATIPVSWSVRRNPGPKGDSPEILKLKPKPNDKPAIAVQANPLQAHLGTDSVGSFYVCPFVDSNGSGAQDFDDPKTGARIDREPFIMLCLVLVRAQGFQNNTVVQPGNMTLIPPNPTSATGVIILTGAGIVNRAIDPAKQAIHFNSIVTVIGGGDKGRLGLDRVFAAWVNNVDRLHVQAIYTVPASGATPAANHPLTTFLSSVSSGTPGIPMVFIPLSAAPSPPTPLPPHTSTAIPSTVAIDLPVLDTSPFLTPIEGTGGNTVSGTDAAQGGSIPLRPTNLPSRLHNFPIGQDWQVQMTDSPSNGASASHPVFTAGTLTSFEYEVDFRCDLCLWTNMSLQPGPPAAPGPDLANELYVSVQTVQWRPIFHITFDPATGASTITVKPTTTLIKEKDQRLATRVESSGLEVRFPIIVRSLADDATK